MESLDSEVLSFSCDLWFAGLMYVAWLEETEGRLTLDLSSFLEADLEMLEEVDLSSLSAFLSFSRSLL